MVSLFFRSCFSCCCFIYFHSQVVGTAQVGVGPATDVAQCQAFPFEFFCLSTESETAAHEDCFEQYREVLLDLAWSGYIICSVHYSTNHTGEIIDSPFDLYFAELNGYILARPADDDPVLWLTQVQIFNSFAWN